MANLIEKSDQMIPNSVMNTEQQQQQHQQTWICLEESASPNAFFVSFRIDTLLSTMMFISIWTFFARTCTRTHNLTAEGKKSRHILLQNKRR